MPVHLLCDTFIPKFREVVFDNIKNKVGTIMACVSEDYVKNAFNKQQEGESEFKEDYAKFCKERETYLKVKATFALLKKLSVSKYRNSICLDLSLNIWIHKKKAYVIPVGESFLYINFTIPQGVEDFSYWNNTDQPENFSQNQWDQRGKLWEKVCLNDWNSNRLNHVIFDAKEGDGLLEISKTLIPDFGLAYAATVIFDEDNIDKYISESDI